MTVLVSKPSQAYWLIVSSMANTVNTEPYCKTRQRLPLKELRNATTTVGLRLHNQALAVWRWKGYNVALTDGATVQMPDTPENQADFPQLDSQKPGLGFPIARMVVLISLAAGTVLDYKLDYRLVAYQGKGTGETSLLSQLFDRLSVGDLLMTDRYYCTFAIIARLQARGIPVLFPIHARKKVDFSLGVRLGARDHLINWLKPKRKPVWMSKQEYSDLPESITVREFTVNGRIYLTTLLNAKSIHKQ